MYLFSTKLHVLLFLMILECKSCNKKFLVPDNAITSSGRLVQCSSCGNKWTQYPVKKEIRSSKKLKSEEVSKPKEKTNFILPKQNSRKSSKKKSFAKKSGPVIYSREYLEKKHGIQIKTVSSSNKASKEVIKSNMGFYSYFFITLILIVAFLGVLNLTKDIVIYNFPFLETYISYLFENLENFIIIFLDMLNIY